MYIIHTCTLYTHVYYTYMYTIHACILYTHVYNNIYNNTIYIITY